MQRFITFVNGSNLFTAFKHLDLYIDDYEELYHYIFEQTVEWWKTTLVASQQPTVQHVRIYWHVVDGMDEWDLSNVKTRQHLMERFQDDRDIRTRWICEATRTIGKADNERLEQAAFSHCLEDAKNWYEKRQTVLSGMNRFHHAVEGSTDFIELCRCGRWKVDLLHKNITERGLDVCLAVNMVTLLDQYDIAILIGGDPEGIAGFEVLKNRGKQIAVVELVKGSPSESAGRGFATPLRLSTDFVVPIFETELIKRQIAAKGGGGEFMLREAS